MSVHNEGIIINGNGSLTAENVVSGPDGTINQTKYVTEKRPLAEAAAEIQKLLEQLEKTNPKATESEQIAYVNIATKPDLKQRAIAALQEGGETALDEFVLENKYLKVIKAIAKGWLQPNI